MCIRCHLYLAAILFGWAFAAAQSTPGHSRSETHSSVASILTASTHSSAAKELFEKGMADFVKEKTEPALESWRLAATKDPRCAVIQAFISFATNDPAEESRARANAKRAAGCVGPGERLLVRWVVNIHEDHYVTGIAAMNDLVALYPKDKRLLCLAGHWLLRQQSYDRARNLFERALTIDSKYPAALSDLGKIYAEKGDFQRAFAAMERCLTLVPREPTPQHSYAEILRRGGNFQGALEHYRAALKLDPGFRRAQLGIADTYALMGEEETARKEYGVAIRSATSIGERIEYEIQSALTYVREAKYGRANAAFSGVAEHAREAQLGQLEARAYRIAATYQPDNGEALRFRDRAESALQKSGGISEADRQEERAQILEVGAIRNAALGRVQTSHELLGQLSRLAETSRAATIEHAYHAAAGSVSVLEHKEAEAIPHLEEDDGNPYSMQQLVLAYNQTGAADKAHALELRIAAINEPTVEQALVVPELRAKLAATRKRRTWLSKIVQH
jgi:tetratricopeptide (TPR) repeat protein